MTEAELQDHVITMAESLRLLVFHSTDSRRDLGYPGFPDLILLGEEVLFAELKDAYGKLSAAQVQWKYAMLAAGLRWRLWRPLDWDTGEIEHELRSIA